MKAKTTGKKRSSYANINQTGDVKIRPPKLFIFVKMLLTMNLSWNIVSRLLEYLELFYGMQCDAICLKTVTENETLIKQ